MNDKLFFWGGILLVSFSMLSMAIFSINSINEVGTTLFNLLLVPYISGIILIIVELVLSRKH